MRVHIALNVENLEKAIDYYSKLLGAPVHKRKPGYANFALDRPGLKLSLFEAPGAPERLNHLGVEAFDAGTVEDAITRLSEAGLAGRVDREATCCYAEKSEVWSADPQGLRWEWYRVRGDSESFGHEDPPAPAANAGEAPSTCGCS